MRERERKREGERGNFYRDLRIRFKSCHSYINFVLSNRTVLHRVADVCVCVLGEGSRRRKLLDKKFHYIFWYNKVSRLSFKSLRWEFIYKLFVFQLSTILMTQIKAKILHGSWAVILKKVATKLKRIFVVGYQGYVSLWLKSPKLNEKMEEIVSDVTENWRILLKKKKRNSNQFCHFYQINQKLILSKHENKISFTENMSIARVGNSRSPFWWQWWWKFINFHRKFFNFHQNLFKLHRKLFKTHQKVFEKLFQFSIKFLVKFRALSWNVWVQFIFCFQKSSLFKIFCFKFEWHITNQPLPSERNANFLNHNKSNQIWSKTLFLKFFLDKFRF